MSYKFYFCYYGQCRIKFSKNIPRKIVSPKYSVSTMTKLQTVFEKLYKLNGIYLTVCLSIYPSVCLFSFILFFRFCGKISDKTVFVVFCFLLRTTSAIGGAASETSAMSIVIEQFPNNVAAVTVCTLDYLFSLTGFLCCLNPPHAQFTIHMFIKS